MRDPTAVRQLIVEGGGVESLAGIERLTGLRSLYLEGLPPLSLEPLRDVAGTLDELFISGLRGDVDAQAIGALTALRRLDLEAMDQPAARAVARVPLGGLHELETLALRSRAGPIAVELGAVAGFPRLTILNLDGFLVQEHDVAAVCAAPALEALYFVAESRRVARRLRDCLEERLDLLMDIEEASPGPLRRFHQRTLSDGRVEHSVGVDLAGDWGLETNPEAEARLRRLLRREAPDVARRIDYDTESSAVWLLSEDRGALEAALTLADRYAIRPDPT